jgi:ketosteroid isomerase-like protein
MGPEAPAALALRFINAFNAKDLEALGEVLHPDVVIHSSRGPRRGINAALAWATRVESGELEQSVVIDHIEVREDREVALVRRQWRWRDGDELAREDEMAYLFELRDAKIASWRPFEDRDDALAELAA